MYGVPADLDLAFLVGQELRQICLGPYDIQFRFDRGAEISSTGEWLLLDPRGLVVDRRQVNVERSEYRVHQLLHEKIVSTRIDAPKSFDLLFEDGHALRFVDADPQFESVTIWPVGIVI